MVLAFGEHHFFVRVVRGPGEHGGKFLRRLGGARSAEVLAVLQNGCTDCPCQVNEWLWRFINKKACDAAYCT